MMPLTRQILGHQDLTKNHQKTFFGNFSKTARKPSKNPPALSKNVERPFQKPSPERFLKVCEGFAAEKGNKGGAHFARAPLCWLLGWQNLSKTIKKRSGDGFWMVFRHFWKAREGFLMVFWRLWENCQKGFFDGF